MINSRQPAVEKEYDAQAIFERSVVRWFGKSLSDIRAEIEAEDAEAEAREPAPNWA